MKANQREMTRRQTYRREKTGNRHEAERNYEEESVAIEIVNKAKWKEE